MPEDRSSHETEEYGGFLLMMDTVPEKSELRLRQPPTSASVSTYIPRILWPDKPLFGREQWVNAWMAGSEFKRDEDFTGPAIGILGATQLNGGAWGRRSSSGSWRCCSAPPTSTSAATRSSPGPRPGGRLTFYNAWLMTVNDDPFVWFYYNYGHTILPPWPSSGSVNKFAAPKAPAIGMAGSGPGANPSRHGRSGVTPSRNGRSARIMILAVCFTNFGPYHLARLRALALRLARDRRPPDRLRGGGHRTDLSLAGRPAR